MTTELYDVWYAAVGCLPDSEGPEFTGTWDECAAYVDSQVAEGFPSLYTVSDFDGNLYAFTIEPHMEDDHA